MKKYTLFVLTVMVLTVLSGIVCFADAPDSGYQMVLNDEFDGTTLNTDIWAYRTGNPSGGKNLEENVRVSNGKLYLDYRKVNGYYTGGGVLTVANLPYGYYETKSKVYTGANGFHTSFWLTGGGSGSQRMAHQPQSSSVIEIDGFEFNSNETGTAPTPAYNMHYSWADRESTGGEYYSCDTDGDPSTSDWFTMGFEWLPGKIIYYCNGEEVGTVSPAVFNPSALWLTALAMPDDYKNADGTYNIDDSKMDANGYFGSSEYEYFRYYSKKLKGVNLLGNGHFELNRQSSLTSPRAFYSTGSVLPRITPFAHSGFYVVQMNPGSTTGQDLQYLASGKYTFEGYFKTNTDLNARLVAYNKAGDELKSISIPANTEWTKVSLTDINVTDSAYVVVEVTDGMLVADDLSFYCQEGETGYESYRDTDYEKYAAVKSAHSSAIVMSASSAERSNSGWKSSTLAGMRNLYTHAYTSTSYGNNYYKNIYANWQTTLNKTGKFDVEIYQITHNNNIENQYYTVTLDGVTVLDKISVKTKDSTEAGAWVKLGEVYGTAGQVVEISMSLLPPLSSGKCVRITPARLIGHDERFADSALVAQISNPIFMYKNTPYAFDLSDATLSPYSIKDEIYIPYQVIKSHLTIPGVDSAAEYVTTTQINASGTYSVLKFGSYIVIYESGFPPSETAVSNVITTLNKFIDPFFHSYKDAVYVGTANKNYQIVFDLSTAILSGNWGSSGLASYDNKSKYSLSGSSASASWEISPAHSTRYSVQFYNIVHAGGGTSNAAPSTKAAGIELSLNGKTYTYTLNQCEGQRGWFDLGEFDLQSADTLYIKLYNAASTGILRANAVRLVPIFEEVTFAGTKDISVQEYYDHSSAVKTGTWTNGTDSYEGCAQAVYSPDNKDASVKWTVSPNKNFEYKIQVFSPQFETAATAGAKIALKINDETHYFLMNQKSSAASGTGWYELGTFELSTTDILDIEISNFAGEGSLYAKAIRLVPGAFVPEFVSNSSSLIQEYYGPEAAKKTGTWAYSLDEYEGCMYAQHTADNKDASITWSVYPKEANTYSIEVYIPKFTDIATSSAAIDLDINGTKKKGFIDERAEGASATGTGWYTLGNYTLKDTDIVSVTMSNYAQESWLRAKAIRLIPQNKQPVFVGNFNETNQELHAYSTATTVGSWCSSQSVLGTTTYYGTGENASITWKPVPKNSQKYSIQVYMPTYTSNSTTVGYVTLTIDGLTHTFNKINQKLDPAVWTGWYDFGVYDLTPNSEITVTMGTGDNTNIRAKDMRLVPFPNTVNVTKSGSAITVNAGILSNYAGSILFAEYDADGRQQSSQILEAAPTVQITMQNANNSYKIFFWENIHTMIPVIPAIEN